MYGDDPYALRPDNMRASDGPFFLISSRLAT